jgi:Cdc6-like AAA superfamily ATPase
LAWEKNATEEEKKLEYEIIAAYNDREKAAQDLIDATNQLTEEQENNRAATEDCELSAKELTEQYGELEDKTKVSIYPAQQFVVFGDTILKFDELKLINKAVRECKPGKRAGRNPRKMPKGFKILAEKGLSYNELARIYNCSKTAIARWKKEIKNSGV